MGIETFNRPSAKLSIDDYKAIYAPIDEFDEALTRDFRQESPDHLSTWQKIGIPTTIVLAAVIGTTTIWDRFSFATSTPDQKPTPTLIFQPDTFIRTTNLHIGTGCSPSNEPRLFVRADHLDTNSGPIALAIQTPDGDNFTYTIFHRTEGTEQPINTGELSPAQQSGQAISEPYTAVIAQIPDMTQNRSTTIESGKEYKALLSRAVVDDDRSVRLERPFAEAKTTAAHCQINK